MRKRRLLLIPAWLLAQFFQSFHQQGSSVGAFEKMTSLNDLWLSFVVIVVVVLYANRYEVVFEHQAGEKPKPAQNSVTLKK